MTGATSHSIFTRDEWTRLRSSVPLLLDEAELRRLRGANEPMPLGEVADIFLPLTRLINLHFDAAKRTARVADDFLGRPAERRPYVLAIAGSVAVGKSTIARVLQALLSRWPDHPRVDLITSDGFLYPKAQLLAGDLMKRKGFPESYDIRSMIRFLADIRETGRATSPVYSHEAYDIVPGGELVVDQPDILIFEGLNVLQIGSGARPAPAYTASDFFDLSIYVDAEVEDVRSWYLERFLLLQRTAFQRSESYFHHLASASEAEARAYAEELWATINLRNLIENILPSRQRADVVIHKQADHSADRLSLRRF
ncbi:MAG: type I pantothenate kinase [Sphingomonadaceae bacterium]|nr:type I pantothenate kinase [Sphingomonadaceae bacterium]